jgi:NAD(P)-dependent dehydrogenase (short-subunit alcohol dehydrogenase family)
MKTDKSWWVLVGGRRRLGRALADRLASHHNLVLTSSRPWESDAFWIKELAGRTQVRTLTWNAEDPRLVSKMMADLESLVEEGIRPVCALILAGVFPEQPVGTWNAEDLQSLWRVNLTFPMLAAQGIASVMEEGASLQFVLDTCIHRPFLMRMPYSASKSALAAMVPGLARALAPKIRVVGHALGTLLPEEGSDEHQLADRSLLKRLGSPDDLLSAALYASKAHHMTGEILTIDGGARWT